MKYPTGTTIRYPYHASVSKPASHKKHNKYNAKKTIVDDIEFASKAEAVYYAKIRHEDGWTCQENFTIIDRFKVAGKTYVGARYKPDFVHRTNGVIDKVVDVKGGNITLTTDARLRIKLFMMRYDIPITIARYDYHSGIFEESTI